MRSAAPPPASMPSVQPPRSFPVHEIPEDMVMRIARLGLADEAEGRTMIPALASPLYVRDRVALTMQERARGERL